MGIKGWSRAAAIAASVAVAAASVTATTTAQAVEPVAVYDAAFDTSAGPEWSNATVATTPSGRSFLGRFGAETVTLTLADVPTGANLSVVFDVYVIDTWDGNGDYCCGPDTFGLRVNGDDVLTTTFSNTGWVANQQAYPDSFPGGRNTALTGAVEVNSLGYAVDAVYRITRTLVHDGGALTLDFVGGSNQDLSDESWGIDNLAVTAQKVDAALSAQPVVRVATRDTAAAVDLSATLTTASGTPIAGQDIRFETEGAALCTARTGADGVAACAGPAELVAAVVAGGYVAVFEETAYFFGSEAAAGLAQVADTSL